MKIRIKFSKYGVMRFIGHLDMMRYFQKAMRRAEIDIAYTEGFSPHQIMSFAAPLGIGLTSQGEYLDIEVHSTKSTEESLHALNETMAEGVWVTEYKRLPEGTKNAMSSVAAADYLVFFQEPEKNPFAFRGGAQMFSGVESDCPNRNVCSISLSEALRGFLEGQEEICITKQTKKSEKVMNLKPLIYELKAVKEPEGNLKGEVPVEVQDEGNVKVQDEVPVEGNVKVPDEGNIKAQKEGSVKVPDEGKFKVQDEGNVSFFMKLCTGSTDNVKPELVLNAFFDYCRKQGICSYEFNPLDVRIHRLEVYGRGEDETFVPLGAMGSDIL